jgi:MoxR-like ATPase
MSDDSTGNVRDLMERILYEIKRVVVGQDHFLERVLIAMLAQGHLLVEGVPGLAKTLTVKTLARTIRGTFKRIQFTPDLLPADLVGTRIYNQKTGDFSTSLGPVFANLLLADEINRAPAKVQSALLEAMQERQVTIGETTHRLPEPFVVVATQNPIEQEGTFALPEAQLDRFLMKLKVGYPTRDQEQRMLQLYLDPVAAEPDIEPVVSLEGIRRLSSLVSGVHVDDRISRYIVELVAATREPEQHGLGAIAPMIEFGASPRATLALAHVAKGHAFLEGRAFVIPEDVKEVAHDVIRHRLILTYEAAAEQVTSDSILDRILGSVPVP